MRAVVATDEGVIEVNWIWLPSFIGMNARLKAELEKKIAVKLEGKILDEATLNEGHDLVCEFLQSKFPTIQGLTDYLDNLKYVYFE